MLDPAPYTFPTEAEVFTRPTISLVSPNAVPQWTVALWIATILMFGILALAAFAIPDAFERVVSAHQEEQI